MSVLVNDILEGVIHKMSQENIDWYSKNWYTKNINNQFKGEEWSWSAHLAGQEFRLHSTEKNRMNAAKVDKGDLIILMQVKKVTHIVEILDEYSSDEGDPSLINLAFTNYRMVKTIRIAEVSQRGFENAPSKKEVFEFPEIESFQNGQYKQLTTPSFLKHWVHKGGVNAFIKHLLEKFP